MRSQSHSRLVEQEGSVASLPVRIGRSSSRSRGGFTRSGFTLVEMLVVITIIGILVALLIPTIAGVMRSTRNAAIGVELNDLTRAVESYKSKTNDFFPDFSSRAAVVNHIRKAYPRNTRNVDAWFVPASPPATQDPRNLDPAEALVFWLSQLSGNVRDPLSSNGDRQVHFKFDTTRLGDQDGDGWQEFYPKYGDGAPYVYFDGRLITVPNTSPTPAQQPAVIGTYAYAWAVYPSPYNAASPAPNTATLTRSFSPPNTPVSTIGVVRPYRSSTAIDARDNFRTWPYTAPNVNQWMNPGGFQIVCAGQDNSFGPDVAGASVTYKTFPAPNYQIAGIEDEDNMASFSESKTLGDSVP